MKKHSSLRGAKRRGGLIFGIAFSAISFVAITAITAFLLSRVNDPISYLGIGSLAALLVSAALSAFVTAKYKGEGGFLTALLSSVIAAAIIFVIGLIFCSGKISLSMLMNILCYLLVSLVFAKLSSRKKKRSRH